MSFKWLIKWNSPNKIIFGMLAFVHNQLASTLNHSAAIKFLPGASAVKA